MATIVIITEECANSIQGVEYTNGVKFNPIQLQDGRWFISEIEAEFISASDIIETIEYEFEILE